MTELPLLSYRASAPAGSVPVSLDHLMVGGLLLQAGSGGGKSTAIRQALEETHGRVQHLVIDPEGEFASLREKFDYVYAAPHGGEAVATPQTARLLCRRLVEVGVSAVLDIYDLKVHEKREFVRLFLEELMALPRSMWKPILVVVDEADFFFPQQGESSALEAGLDVNGRGRKRGYRMILTTRRISKLHKDVADVQNRMIGRTGLDLDMKRAGDELGMDKEARQTLARLEPGTFYVYGPAISATPVLARTGEIRTTHPQAGRIGSVAPPAPAKIRAMLSQFADLPKEAAEEARTLEDLRRENAELKRHVRQAEKGGTARVVERTVVDQHAIERAVNAAHGEWLRDANRQLAAAIKPYQQGKERARRDVEKSLGMLRSVLNTMEPIAVALGEDAAGAVLAGRASIADVLRTASVSAPAPHAPARPLATPQPRAVRTTPAEGVTGVEQRILNTIAGMMALGVAEPDKATVAALVGYHPNAKSYANAMGSLRTAGRIAYGAGGRVTLTADGQGIAENSLPVSSRAELHRLWFDRLGNVAERILAPVLEAYPSAVAAADVAAAADYHPNAKSFANMKGRLRTLGLIDYPASGMIVATPILFPEGLA